MEAARSYLHPVDENVVSIGHAQALRQDFTPFEYPFVHRLAVQGGVTGFVLSTALLFGPLLSCCAAGARRPAAPPSRSAPSAC